MSTAGIIFSNVHDNNIPELTAERSIGSVPFACRYRFIDFILSNMVNSDISDISVITNNNYMSLLDHLGNGKDWDLARRSGGLKILSTNLSARNYNNTPVVTRLETLKGVYPALKKIKDEYVLLADCDVICNVDIKPLIKDHIAHNADITFAVRTMDLTAEEAKSNIVIYADEDGRMTDVLTYPEHFSGKAECALNVMLMKTDYLRSLVDSALSHGYNSLTRDIVAKNLTRANYRVFRHTGYFATIASMEDYYRYTMQVLNDPAVYDTLFNVKSRPVLTKVRNSAPSYFSASARVADSMIADGCVIEGTVENSVLFRGVHVGRNAVVKDCILMQDTEVGEGAFLHCVVSDKNVTVSDRIMLSGIESQPYFIAKGKKL